MASIPLIVAYVGGQEKLVQSRQAGYYSLAFTSGLFITIALDWDYLCPPGLDVG